jgi:phosphatidate cytidylyltransferase
MITQPIFIAAAGGVVVFLILCTLIGRVLARRVLSPAAQETVANLNACIRSWWGIVTVFGAAVVLGRVVTIVLFTILSFLSFREFMSLTPTRRGDHARCSWRSLSSCRSSIG